MTYKLFLDTNFLLDVMLENRPEPQATKRLMELASNGDVLCTISTASLADAYYVARHGLAEELRRTWLGLFLDLFGTVAPDAETCRRALASDEPDYEDGVIRTLAESTGSDYLISRDERAFANSAVPRVSAGEFLALAGIA